MNKAFINALVVNFLTLSLVFLLAFFFDRFFYNFNLFQFLGIYSVLAAVLSLFFKLPVWWWFFNALFPWFLALAFLIALPPVIYLVAFIIFWLFFTGISNTRVPYYPTQSSVTSTLKQQFPVDAHSMLDVGSGFGGWCLSLQKSHPHLQVTGIEMAFLPWLISVFRAKFSRSSCRFIWGDYRQLNWLPFDVVYAYLSPLVMESIWKQACSQMRPDTYLISCEFDIQSEPGQRLSSSGERNPDVFIWRMNPFLTDKGVVWNESN